MSHVIHIWEHAPLTSFADADRLHARLSRQSAPPNPKFSQLAQGLLRVFPHAPQGTTTSPWTAGPPDGSGAQAVWALDIDARQRDRVLPELVEQAIALGLTVYDGPSGEAFLPGRWRLSPEGLYPLTWDAPAPASAAGRDAVRLAFEARVRAVVLPRLAGRGFRLEWRTGLETHDALAFLRETPLGQQRIELTPTAWSEQHWDLALSCELAPRLPAELLAWSRPQDTIPLTVHTHTTLAEFYRDAATRAPFTASFRCLGTEAQERFLQQYAEWVAQALLPVLDATTDLAGYLRLDGQPAGEGIVVQASAAGLALAHCAGDAALADRAERYGQQRTPDPRPAQFRRRVEDLARFPQYWGLYAPA